jgi:hypothetical protein
MPKWDHKSSDETGTSEGIKSPAGRVICCIAYNHVIQKIDTNRLCGLSELARNLNVGGARRRISAGMIVLCCAPSYVEWLGISLSGFALRESSIAAHK